MNGLEEVSFSIVMPAYNEEANIEKTVRACSETLASINCSGEIIVTNDGSKDRTFEVLQNMCTEFPNLKIVHHPVNRGYGAALKSAISASSGDYIITIDSDGQFDIKELPYFLKPSNNGTAVVTGYRKKKSDTVFRVFANKGLNGMIKVLFGAKFKDINCAFRLYRSDVLKAIDIESTGYQAPSEIMIKIMNLGHNFREVGVSHYSRAAGQSALKPFKTIVQMSAFLVYLKLKTILFKKGLLNSL